MSSLLKCDCYSPAGRVQGLGSQIFSSCAAAPLCLKCIRTLHLTVAHGRQCRTQIVYLAQLSTNGSWHKDAKIIENAVVLIVGMVKA